jgi:hypothetical protein
MTEHATEPSTPPHGFGGQSPTRPGFFGTHGDLNSVWGSHRRDRDSNACAATDLVG